MLPSSQESKFCAKHVNTCLDDFGALERGGLRVLWLCHMDIGCMYKPDSVKNMVSCALISQNAKCTCISLSSRSNPPHSTHIMMCIPVQ